MSDGSGKLAESLRLRYMKMPKDKRAEVSVIFDEVFGGLCRDGMSDEDRDVAVDEAMSRGILQVELEGEMELGLDDIDDAPCPVEDSAFVAEDRWGTEDTMDRVASRMELANDIEQGLVEACDLDDFDFLPEDRVEFDIPLFDGDFFDGE